MTILKKHLKVVMMAMIELTTKTFKETVLENEKPVLVDFWAAWCGPCRMLAPVVEELAGELADKAVFCKLNVDDEQELAMAFGVQTIPTMILFYEGEETGRLVGLHPKEKIMEFMGF